MLRKISGTGVALVTPFKSDLSIDFEALTSLVNHCVDGNIDFLVVMGTTGESVTLSLEEKNAALDCVKQANNDRLPIVLGIGGNNTDYIIQSFSSYNLDGVDAILSVSPAYNKPTQEGLYQHYKAINDKCGIPIIIYNIPGRSVIDMSVDTMAKLYELKNIIGVKDATGDLNRVDETLKKMGKDFMQLTGNDDNALEFNKRGGVGAISVTANIAPKLCSEFQKFSVMNDEKSSSEAEKINEILKPVHHSMFVESNPSPVKYAAKLLKLCEDEVRLPLVKVTDSTKEIIKKALKSADLI